MRVALVLVLLLAGCTTPNTPVPTDAVVAAPEILRSNCITWSSLVDAPASAFPAHTGHEPLPGATPGTIVAAYEGALCGDDVELIEAYPVRGLPGAAILSFWWTSSENDTRTLNAWGVPAQAKAMTTYFMSRTEFFYNDGPGDTNATRVVSTAAVAAPGSPPRQHWEIHVIDQEETRAIVEREGSGGSTWWRGLSSAGDRSAVAADDWRGPGHRQVGVTLANRPLEP